MKQTVYVDVLLAINFFINYFLLLSTSRIMRCEIKRVNICLAAIVGAASSLSIFLPTMHFLINAAFKLAVSGVMVLTAFGKQKPKIFFRYCLVMCAVTFSFGGAMLALWITTAPNGMYYRNGIAYFNVSPEFIIVVTIVCYSVITIVGRIINRRERYQARIKAELFCGDKIAKLTLIADTGNSLSEPFSGYPVIVVKREAVKCVLPKGFDELTKTGNLFNSCTNCRVIPYNSVGGGGLLIAFLPEKITAVLNKNKKEIINCYVAVSDSMSFDECDGIINPSIFND